MVAENKSRSVNKSKAKLTNDDWAPANLGKTRRGTNNMKTELRSIQVAFIVKAHARRP